ncbi:MAG: Gmad2 immunoglobulin-like domain-containing protein [Anaerolineae bacterium]
MRVLTIFALIFLMAACTAAPAAGPTATPGLTGRVDIVYPPNGTTVYAEALTLRGTAQGLASNSFILEVVGVDDEIIARSTVTVTDGQWAVELPHNYSGEPIETAIYALPPDADLTSELRYDVGTIVLAGLSYRPEGTFGTITSPPSGNTVGGEFVPVSGTASGLFEGTLLVGMYGSDGAEISRIVLTIDDQFYNLVPWTAELPTNGYTGTAEIRAFYQQASDGKAEIIASVQVTVTPEAG